VCSRLFVRDSVAPAPPGRKPAEKKDSRQQISKGDGLMFYLIQVYALVIAVVLLPVFLLYTLTTLSRRAISAVRHLRRSHSAPIIEGRVGIAS